MEAPVPEMPAVETPVAPIEPVAEMPVETPIETPVASVEPVASAPVQEVFSPVNAPVSEPVVEAAVPEMPAVETPVAPLTGEPTEQFDMASVNTTNEAKKDTSDLEVFNIE